jgi:hypothetical protein
MYEYVTHNEFLCQCVFHCHHAFLSVFPYDAILHCMHIVHPNASLSLETPVLPAGLLDVLD